MQEPQLGLDDKGKRAQKGQEDGGKGARGGGEKEIKERSSWRERGRKPTSAVLGRAGPGAPERGCKAYWTPAGCEKVLKPVPKAPAVLGRCG